jgi:DNA-binding NtrC family response regulator
MAEPLMLADVRARRFGRARAAPPELLGGSPAIARVLELIRRAAGMDGGVLLIGEPGTAVDAIARHLHAGRHAAGPYVIVDCSAADAARGERLLFGTPPADAATDLESVSTDSPIAAARGGTLFLRDVTELAAAAQARLARIARDGEVRIEHTPVATGLRIIASSAPSIDADVHAHRFRADLYRRLASVRIDVPPLRERSEDVPAIAIRLLEDICDARGVAPRVFSEAALTVVAALTWPGNLEELHAAIDRVVSDSREDEIQIEHLLPALPLDRARATFVPAGSLRDARLKFEREYITAVLQHNGWRMADAAQTLGIQRPNLYRKARQLGIPLMRVSE